MSDKTETSGSDIANGIGVILAVICGFAGHAQGGWPVALAAAAMAYGGVRLLFFAVGVAMRFVVLGVVLLIAFAILKNRYDWLAGLFS